MIRAKGYLFTFSYASDNTPYEKIGNNDPVSIADEVPFDIPESWEWVRLGSAFDIIMGQSPAGETVKEYGCGMEFHQGKIHFGKRYLNKTTSVTTSPTKIAPADSVLLCVRAPVGKVNITDREICIGRGLCAVIPLGGITAEFLYFLLETYEEFFTKQATGTTFIAITGEVVKKQLVPVPPIEEQKRIVEKIESLLPYIHEYGEKEEMLSIMNKQFPEQLKKSILQMAVQGKLVKQDPNDEPASVLLKRIRAEREQLIEDGKIKRDKNESIIYRRDNSHYEKLREEEHCIDEEIPFEIPETWVWQRLRTIADLQTGTTPPTGNKDYFGPGIPFIKPGDISPSGINYFNESLTELGSNKSRLILRASVLMVCIGGSIGKCYYTDRDVCCNQQINAASPYAINHKYLWIVLSSDYIYKRIIATAGGTATPIINKSIWGELLIPIPPINEQELIITMIDALSKSINLL